MAGITYASTYDMYQDTVTLEKYGNPVLSFTFEEDSTPEITYRSKNIPLQHAKAMIAEWVRQYNFCIEGDDPAEVTQIIA